MPTVAATLVPASSTGMPAAISAPKASSIRISVTGRLSVSADGQVVGDPVVDRLVEADVAGLADVELREVGLHGLGDVLQRRDVVLVAGQLDRDEVRRTVRADLGLGDLVDALELGHAGHDRGGGLLGLRLVEVAGLGGDQHLLGVRRRRSRRSRPWRPRGRTHRAGSRRRWSPGSGSSWPGRRRRRRTRPSRGSRATGGGRTSERCGGRRRRAGSSWLQPSGREAARSGVPGPDPWWCWHHCPDRPARGGWSRDTTARARADRDRAAP